MSGKSGKSLWWHSLSDECPITLELLSTLPYPPFALSSGGITSHFDGLALASYVVSRGIFQNPLTREDLTSIDCRRLDEYLEKYCYGSKLMSTTRKISVAEAFGLRNSIQIDTSRDELSQSRARALRSTATAALAGLFVYGNDRGGVDENVFYSTVSAVLPREDQLLRDWGFDLARTVDDVNDGYCQEGWTVIDDDEALVVASKREAYQATQNAFPRLVEHSEPKLGGGIPMPPKIDEDTLVRIREMSVAEEKDRLENEKKAERRRQQILQDAMKRREERRKIRQQQFEERKKIHQEKVQEHEEVERARAEIEKWREQQWEKLRQLSESQKPKAQPMDSKRIEPQAQAEERDDVHVHNMVSQKPAPEELEEKRKAKAAAKRKRAKERKKAEKAQERVEQEKLSRQQALDKQKAASASKCATCAGGIIDAGFEKVGKKFCSTKCARACIIKST